MSLHKNIGGTIKTISKLTQNVGGTLKTITSFKQNVGGTFKELLKSELITSGTIIIGWQATGNASITIQDGETVSAKLYHNTTNVTQNISSKIYSGAFYIEAGTKITFNVKSQSPSGPLGAYLVNSSGSAAQIGASGSSLGVNTSGYYTIALAGCGIIGSQSGSGPTSGTFTATFSIT